jgi:hypothetical protein
VPYKHLADDTIASKQGISRHFFYVPLRLRIAAYVGAVRLKLDVIGFRWNVLEDFGKDGRVFGAREKLPGSAHEN